MSPAIVRCDGDGGVPRRIFRSLEIGLRLHLLSRVLIASLQNPTSGSVRSLSVGNLMRKRESSVLFTDALTFANNNDTNFQSLNMPSPALLKSKKTKTKKEKLDKDSTRKLKDKSSTKEKSSKEISEADLKKSRKRKYDNGAEEFNKSDDPHLRTDGKKAKLDSLPSPSSKSASAVPLNGNTNAINATYTADDDAEDTDLALGDVAAPIESAQKNAVDSFGMSEATVNLLTEKSFTSLFEIQAATFRLLRHERKDVIARARTGSGKTLAFVLPIVEALVSDNLHRSTARSDKPLVLCLAPTRELAQQVHRDFEWIASAHGILTSCFTGGTMKGPQKGALRRGLDVLVATPGRVIDLMDEGYLSLGGVRYIVLDEADEMLSMGFQEPVEKILQACTSKEMKQTLLFSATIPRWVKDLARKYMRVDATVTVDTVSDSKNRTNSDITHLAISCPPSERPETLADVVKVYTGAYGKTLIFTDTKAEANEVGSMEKVVSALGGAGVLHGDIPQGQRETTLAAYREGRIRVLVATDVAARGLDIKAVDLVLQTHPPSNYETYIHRSGRTGRAGKTGTCVTFYSQKEKFMVGLIEHKAGIKMRRVRAPQAADIVRASVEDTVKKLGCVHADNLALFREVARKVVASYGEGNGEDAAERALAASLACMAGYSEEKFKCRSMLSCFQGFVAVVMTSGRELDSPKHAWGLVRQTVGYEMAGAVKGMQVCKDRQKAVFDVPEDKVKSLIGRGGGSGFHGVSFEVAEDELPELEDEFDLQAATAMMNERRNGWRGKGGYGGGGGGRGSGGRGGKWNAFENGSRRSSWGGGGGGGYGGGFGGGQGRGYGGGLGGGGKRFGR